MARWTLGMAMLGTVVLAAGWPHGAAAQPLPRAAVEGVEAYVERLEPFGFSGVVLVGTSRGPALLRSYGLANREEGRPFLPSTVVTIGSITKSVTAAAVMKLQEMGRLHVDDLVARHLPGVPADKSSITLHHLLSHTSGLKRNGLDGGDFNLEATREAVLREALTSPLLSPPGERYSYSNLGYALLGMVVERASGVPYETFVTRHLLRPAGMYRTGYLEPFYRDEELAWGYRDDRSLGPVIRQPMLADGPTWNLRANGGLHSHALDMYRWTRALQRAEILSPASVEALTTPHAEQPGGLASYGYGLEVRRTAAGVLDVSHSGGNGYFAADLHWFPEDDRMVFVAVNEAGAVHLGRLSEALTGILFGEDVELPPEPVSLPAETVEGLVGHHLLPSGDTIAAVLDDGALRLTAHGTGAMQLLLGGERGLSHPSVAELARRSAQVVEAEFAGDFEPKFEAMAGVTSLADLARYHGYDRAYWDAEFGALDSVSAVAGAASGSETVVVVRIRFRDGAAAQIHTWRDGRLANVSVLPDWADLQIQRTLHPVAPGRFESFDQRTLLRVRARIADPDGSRSSLIFVSPDGEVRTRPGGWAP